MAITATSDFLPVGLQNAPNANYWTAANLTGSFFTTAWQSLSVDNSPSDVDYLFTGNLLVGAAPVAGVNFGVGTIPTSQVLWRLRLKVKLTAAYSGASTITFYLVNNGTFSTASAPYSVANTPTPGSWVTIDIDFNTALWDGVGGPANLITWQFAAADAFPMEFRITHAQLFRLGPAYVPAPENDVALNFNYLLHDFNEHGKSID